MWHVAQTSSIFAKMILFNHTFLDLVCDGRSWYVSGSCPRVGQRGGMESQSGSHKPDHSDRIMFKDRKRPRGIRQSLAGSEEEIRLD
jgi:hypothetical protein